MVNDKVQITQQQLTVVCYFNKYRPLQVLVMVALFLTRNLSFQKEF
jgi:hypothetical protein